MDTVLSSLLEASFRGSIVILAVVALRFVLKKAPKSLFCLLWLLAGLRLMLPFQIESMFSLQPRLEDSGLIVQAEHPVQVPDILIQNPDGLPLDTPVQAPTLPEGNWSEPESESFLYYVEDGVLTGPLTFLDFAGPIWLLGLGVMLVLSLVSYLRLQRRVSEACRCADGCWECPGLETAFVLGFVNPRIYLPTGLSDRERKFIFDHENTHIARHDHISKLLGYLVLSVHWFNPLVWLGYHLLCRDIELACDEHVVKYMDLTQRKAYSNALLTCGTHTSRFAACPVAFGESSPRQRILNVLSYKKPTVWIMGLALIAVIFVSVCLLTSPSDAPDLSFLNYENAISTLADQDTVMTVYFKDNSIIPCQVDGGELATYLDNVRWTRRRWEPRDLSSPGSVEFVISEDYRITVFDRNFARITYGEEVRYYRTQPGDYRLATELPEAPTPPTEPPATELPQLTPASTAELVQQCREAMEQLKQSRELYLHIVNLDNPNEVTNTYMRSVDGWLFQYRRPGWDYKDVTTLHYGSAQFIFTGTYDDTGVLTSPYYWQTETDPDSTLFQLPYPFDLDWSSIDLQFSGYSAEYDRESITLTFPSYLDVFTFTFDDQGNLLWFNLGDSSGEPEATTTRVYTQHAWRGNVKSQLEMLFREASATADRKPEPLTREAYQALFTRETQGDDTSLWISDLFDIFYQDPKEFVSQLAALNQQNPDRVGQVLMHMSDKLAVHAPQLFEYTLYGIPENHHPQMLERMKMLCPGKAQQQKDEIEQAIYANAQLAKCNTALHNYKSQGAWCLVENNFFSGGSVLNTSSDTTWYVRGSNYLCHTRIPEDGGCSDFWNLRNDGICHHRQGFTSNGPEFGESWESEWNTGIYDNNAIQIPWPLWFNWSTADLNYMETTEDDYFENIQFWTLGDPTGLNGAVQKYTVTFRLKKDGTLQSIRLNYLYGDTQVEKLIVPRETTREEVNLLLSQHHQEALSHTQHHEEGHHDDNHHD